MYECALVEWFELVGNTPDPIVRIWIVKPEFIGNRRAVGIVSVESIVCSCYLMPVNYQSSIPTGFHFLSTLDAFHRYYVNVYTGYLHC